MWSGKRIVFILKSVAQCMIELKKDQEEIIEALGNQYQNYNLVMATTFGLPIGDSYLRTKMQDIIDEDRRKNAELMENAFYNKENLNPQMKEQAEGSSTIIVPDGVDAELLMKVLGNPEMAALLTSLAKPMKE